MQISLKKPSDPIIRQAIKLLDPWKWATDPVISGLEHIPEKGPVLFVGNHTVLGLLDAPLMWCELYQRKHLFVRSLGDRLHFKVPGWRDMLKTFGAVEGTRANCAELMRNGEHILVFPGGSREVNKRKNEKYQLIWKERLGFARMAIEFACPIVPFAAVGAEECYDIVIDADDIFSSPLGPLLRKIIPRDETIPLVKGWGGTLFPRPERFYFKFGKPIQVDNYHKDYQNRDYCVELRETVRQAIEQMLREQLELRANDPDRDFTKRLSHKFRK
ncbi:MAG: acyltransferase family protein [SAR324 cluster bacterium]|nr:acyltransferase family protein [SAR324 cluster bacterium]